MEAVVHHGPDECLEQSASGEQQEPTSTLLAGSDDQKGAMTYMIHRGPL